MENSKTNHGLDKHQGTLTPAKKGDFIQKNGVNRELRICLSMWCVYAAITLLLARQNGSEPGLYYDEAVFAGTAKETVTQRIRGPHMPGIVISTVHGTPIPLFIQSYLGGLKCWLLAPVFYCFGETVPILRFASLAFNLIGLLIGMAWMTRYLGIGQGLVFGALLASDPAFFFLGVLDWGVAVPSFVCRFACFYFICSWWDSRRTVLLFCAGICSGIGFLNKIDFAVPIAGALSAAIVCDFRHSRVLLMRQPLDLFVAAAGFLLGSGPMLLNLPAHLLDMLSGRTAGNNQGEFQEKISTILAMYDGSYFYRLMDCGGMFQSMHQLKTPVFTPFGAILVVAIVGLGLALITSNALSVKMRQRSTFVMLAFFLTSIGTLLLPGGVRLHHTTLVYPFPQILISLAAGILWNYRFRFRVSKVIAKGISAVGISLLFSCQLWAISQTQQLIHETGGRGRWSESFDKFCHSIDHHPELTIVSLDWGFNEQLNFLTKEPHLEEPIWSQSGKPRGQFEKNPNVIYLIHPLEYNLFIRNPEFEMKQAERSGFKVKPYHDRKGGVAFYTIRYGIE